MTAPKRYSIVRGDPGYRDQMCARPEGRYVTWDDYATLAAKCEALERERDALLGSKRDAWRSHSEAMDWRFVAERNKDRTEALAARVRSLEEVLQKSADREFIAKCIVAGIKSAGTYHAEVKALHPFLLSIAKRAAGEMVLPARAALSTPREEWDPSGFDIKHDPSEPLPSYHWDFEDTREEGSE